MRKLKLFILILSLGLISSTSFSEDGEEEAVQPSNPQELLEIVKQGQFADTQQQRDREQNQFPSNKVGKIFGTGMMTGIDNWVRLGVTVIIS